MKIISQAQEREMVLQIRTSACSEGVQVIASDGVENKTLLTFFHDGTILSHKHSAIGDLDVDDMGRVVIQAEA